MKPYSKAVKMLIVACLCVCLGAGCVTQATRIWVKRATHRDWTFFVWQTIPVELQQGRAITIKFRMGNPADHDVGIRCSPEVWNMLTTNIDKTTVQLKWSNKKNTEIYGIHPGLGEEIPSSYGGGGFSMGLMSVVPNGHYLFAIAGKPHAKVVVEVTFPGGPSEPTPVEIIVTESAEATDLL